MSEILCWTCVWQWPLMLPTSSADTQGPFSVLGMHPPFNLRAHDQSGPTILNGSAASSNLSVEPVFWQFCQFELKRYERPLHRWRKSESKSEVYGITLLYIEYQEWYLHSLKFLNSSIMLLNCSQTSSSDYEIDFFQFTILLSAKLANFVNLIQDLKFEKRAGKIWVERKC